MLLLPHQRYYRYALLFIALMVAIGAAANSFLVLPLGVKLLLWAALYLPALLLPRITGWPVTGFGVNLNLRNLLLSGLLLLILLAYLLLPEFTQAANWSAYLVEGFARTGEEFFFRGFVFALFFDLFHRFRPTLIAILLTTLTFTLVHTQYLLPGAQSDLTLIFSLSLILSVLRAWTHSVLPGILLHLVLNLAHAGAVIGLIIYGLFVCWAYRRKEDLQIGSAA